MSTDQRPVIAIVASAGGITALQSLLGNLPDDLPAALLVVLHLPATAGGALPRILERAGPFAAHFGQEGEAVKSGEIYVAPPDRHLMVSDGAVRLSTGPRQNGHRPSADSLLFSVALAAGPFAFAVVLSGALDDGAAGAAAVAAHGGTVFVQDPAEALYQGMPKAALAEVPGAVVAPAAELAVVLDDTVRRRTADSGAAVAWPRDPELERRVSLLLAEAVDPTSEGLGTHLELRCPACGGPIYVTPAGEEGPERYECVIGHAWSGATLLDGQSSQVATALEVAVQQLSERLTLARRLADRAREAGRSATEARYAETVSRTERALRTLRQMLETMRSAENGGSVES